MTNLMMLLTAAPSDVFWVSVAAAQSGSMFKFAPQLALSPMLVGWLRDRSGSYANGFAALILLAAIGAIAVALLPRKSPAK